jgi:hypothetical protein
VAVPAPALAAGAPAAPAGAAPGAVSGRPQLTGPYRLFCPGTLLGDLVLTVKTSARLSPRSPAPGHSFTVSGLQLSVTFPQGLDEGLHTLAPISGTATEELLVRGATPAVVRTKSYAYAVPTPAVVPPAGVALEVPATPATVGPFTATAGPVVVEESSSQTLVISAGASKPVKLALNCIAFPAKAGTLDPQAPWTAAKAPPASLAIKPVIAVSA